MSADRSLCPAHDGLVQSLKETREQLAGVSGQLDAVSGLLRRIVDRREEQDAATLVLSREQDAARLTLQKERLKTAREVTMRLLQRDVLIAIVVLVGLLSGTMTMSTVGREGLNMLPISWGTASADSLPAELPAGYDAP